MKSIQQLTAWVTAHPFKACAASSVFTFLATFLACQSVPLGWAVAIYFTVALLFGLVLWLDRRKALLLLLPCLLTLPTSAQVGLDAPREPVPVDAGGVAIGITVVVIGGVAWYVLTKTCQKLFPKPPEKTNDQFHATGPASDDYAASLSYQSPHSCAMPDSLTAVGLDAPREPLTSIELSGVMDASGRFHLSPPRPVPAVVLDVAAFQSALSAHGIALSQQPGQCFYGRNGLPATAEQVPVTLDPVDHALVMGQGVVHPLLIERSADLVQWEPLLLTRLPAGQTVRICDLSSTNAMFYRIH